uniref:Uncharacterized protein n=1 Tax=Populus trichocarpa TaxID=3694 RepID=A0A2K1ZTZ9_POPTR
MFVSVVASAFEANHGNKSFARMRNKSAAAAALVAFKDQANFPVKLDEFDRDINLQKRMDMEKRAKARQRRKTRFDSKRLSCMEVDSSDEKIKGELSTDESESDSEKNDAYQSTRDLLLRTAEEIFSDASSNIPNFQW